VICHASDVAPQQRELAANMATTTLRVDLTKSVFQRDGAGATEAFVLQKKLRRGAMLDFLGKLDPCLIRMEACATVRSIARRIGALSNHVKLILSEFMKYDVRRQTNNAADARATCKAVPGPRMRFVTVKTQAQQSVYFLY
jgi:transposase